MPSTVLKTYDAFAVQMVFNNIPISGFGPDTMVSITKSEDAFMLQVGADGFSTRAKSNNNSGEVTFTLAQTSASNDDLSNMHALDLGNSTGSGGIGTLMVKDNNGNTLCEADTAWIKKFPDAAFAREAGTREWTIATNNLKMFVGGN